MRFQTELVRTGVHCLMSETKAVSQCGYSNQVRFNSAYTAGCIFGGQAPSCTAHFAHEKIKNPCSATRLRCSDSSLIQLQRLERGRIGISGWKENRLISLSCSRRWAPKDPDAEQIVAKQWLPDYQPYRIEGPLRTLRNVLKYF